jgi:HD-GYP domain-containing protein (c-di-GMP phosphodiesterase class II)
VLVIAFDLKSGRFYLHTLSAMSKQIVELPVEHLKLGLYVSQLDRPWIETPFLFQGFAVQDEQELAELRRLCRSVFVEVTATEAEELRKLSAKPGQSDGKARERPAAQHLSLHAIEKNLTALQGQVPVKDSVPLKAELTEAKTVHAQAKQAVSQMMDRLRRGRGLDVPQLESAVDSMVESVVRNRDAMGWLARMKDKDDYLYRHSLAASVWALAFGRHLGLDKDTLKALGIGAMLLDIGKTKLPTELLQKTAKPTAEEWLLIRAHVEHGLEFVRSIPKMDEQVIAMVGTHHERFDGEGYPRKLSGDAIPLIGRIAGIVDCYDAMTSERHYAKPKSTYDSVRELKRLGGTWFQSELVELFIQAVGVFPTGTLVELNTGEVGVVVGQNRFRRLRPEVMLILDAQKKLRADFVIADLQEQSGAVGDTPSVWITRGLEAGAYGIDPTEYFL